MPTILRVLGTLIVFRKSIDDVNHQPEPSTRRK